MKDLNEIFAKWEKFNLKDGAELFIKDEYSVEKYNELLCLLNNLGYETKFQRYEGNVKFFFMKKDENILYISFSSKEKNIRVILKRNGVLSLKNEHISSEKTSPLITQVKLAYISADCGMCYIIRLCDGRFILIDSGIGEYEEADHIFELLKRQSPNFEKPIIAAWFITHAHDDHYEGFISFVKKYIKKVHLENLVYNFEKIDASIANITEFEQTLQLIKKDTEIIIARTGQRFSFPDCVFDVLFTGEDLYPQEIYNLNDSSLVMRMELSGRKVLWLGDAMAQSSDYMCSKYEEESFKCDFLQVGHHGYAGGSEQLYKWANPEILLWPCPDFWYPVVKNWKPNEILLNSEKVTQILISGQQETVIDLSKPIQEFKPYKSFKEGETVYNQNFKNKSVLDLGWSCIKGGSTGYASPIIEIDDEGCVLTANDAFSVCEFIQLGQISKNPNFTLKISGELQSEIGEFGLFWNYPFPTIFDANKIIWFETTKEGKFDYKFVANYNNNNKMSLYFYDEFIREFSYDEVFAICFVMKNCCIKLKELRLISGI